MGRVEVCTRVWWGNLREQPHGRPRHRLGDNIKKGIHEFGWRHGLDRWRALVSAVMNLRFL